MFIKLKSSNEKYTFVLKKNPASGMNIRSLRKGSLFSWFAEDGSYNSYFRDGIFESSYSRDEKDYMDTTYLNSPHLAYDMICELFSENQKKCLPDDVNSDWEIFISAVHFSGGERALTSFFPELEFEFSPMVHYTQSLKVSAKGKTFHYMINVLSLVLAHQAFKFNQYAIYFDEMKKIISYLDKVDAPYFARYLFKYPAMRFPEKWKEFQPLLSTERIKMTRGNNEQSRKDFVSSQLDHNFSILDIGCGEGQYFNHSEKVERYYAVDIDEAVRLEAQARINKKELTKVSLFESIDLVKASEKVDVLMIEVIEHMPLEKAEELIKKVMNYNFNKILITTPNRDFNKNYLMQTQFRHDDHHFEFTEKEFYSWIEKVFPNNKIKFHLVGDVVDGSSTSVGAVIYG